MLRLGPGGLGWGGSQGGKAKQLDLNRLHLRSQQDVLSAHRGLRNQGKETRFWPGQLAGRSAMLEMTKTREEQV